MSKSNASPGELTLPSFSALVWSYVPMAICMDAPSNKGAGYTPLHNAAWAGSGDLVDLLIARGHPVDIRDPRYNATPLDYALHDCLVEKRHPEGEFA